MGEGVSTISRGAKSERRSERMETRPQVDMDSRKFKSAITRAHRYTDDNYHTIASATAAKAFGYNDLEKDYRQIEKEHIRMGHLGGDLGDRRRALDDEMEKRIRRDYGEKGIKAWNRAKS